MNKYTWKHFVGCMALVLLASCGGQKEEHNEKEGVETVLPEQLNEVTVVKLLPQTFHHELVSNGKVSAREHADLYFRTAEVVAKVYVKNGDFVRKGQKLAELDLFRLENSLAQRKNALAQATLSPWMMTAPSCNGVVVMKMEQSSSLVTSALTEIPVLM